MTCSFLPWGCHSEQTTPNCLNTVTPDTLESVEKRAITFKIFVKSKAVKLNPDCTANSVKVYDEIKNSADVMPTRSVGVV